MTAGAPRDVAGAVRFEQFVRIHQDMVYATAIRLLGRPADAEDVAQDVFLRAYEQFDRLGDSPAAGAWLRTVARNACLNHLTRYRARWRLFSEMRTGHDDPELPDALLAAPAPVPEPDGDEVQAARLEEALQQLPDAQRVPLVLFHFEGTSYQEIARLLGISLAKVKTDIHRGRERLKAILTRDGTR